MKYKYDDFLQTTRKTLSFSNSTYQSAVAIASKIGFTFNEYLRYLIAEDIRKNRNIKPSSLSEIEKKELSKLLYDIKHRKFRSSEEIESIVRRLVE